MKYAKIFRILGIAIILSLLVLAIPAAPAQAAREIELYDEDGEEIEQGEIGDEITITGDGFSASTDTSDKYVDIYFTLDGDSTAYYIDNQVETYALVKEGIWIDEDGEFETTFDVPDELDDEDVESGTYYICVTRVYTNPDNPTTRIGAYAEFTVVAGEIELDPDEGPVGTLVEISGSDFPVDEEIEFEFDGVEVDIEDDDYETDRDGEFVSFILIPESTAGEQTITVIVAGSEVEAEFTVEPYIILSSTSGEVGTTVTVSGTGFGNRKDVDIWFHTWGVATGKTGRYGSFTITFPVPTGLEDGILYDIEAKDKDRNTDKARFTITVPPPPTPTPAPTPTPTPIPTPAPTTTPATGSLSPVTTGPVGTDLIISGTGFKAGGKVTIQYDGEEVSTTTAAASGILIAAFKVPVSKAGKHSVTASDGTNILELTFTMESKAPTTPAPLLPQMGVKVKSPIFFDWGDVTDESPPVTYTLQITTSKDFDATSMVLEKEGLTNSEYTLTEELAGKETPYYWRARAIDAASNEGKWTGAGEFYVTAPFAIPGWAIYALIGLGGLLLFGLGYWLGRRTAFYY